MMENKKMRAEHPKKELAVDILYDIIGSILFGAGIYTFAEGGNFAPGGISGIALIMNKLWNLPVGTMTLILNIPLVIISYKTVGKRFLMKPLNALVTRLPLVSTVNGLGGAALGLVCGGLTLFVAVWAMQRFGWLLTPELIDNTTLLKFFATQTPLGLLAAL